MNLLKKTTRKKAKIGVMLWIGILCISANTYSQAKLISLEAKNVPLETVLKQIESQSDYSFLYTDRINLKKEVSIQVSNRPIEEVLNTLFGNTNITFRTEEKRIILQQKEPQVGVPKTKGITITGAVFDENNESIAGATILVKGTTRGVSTDLDGTFTIQATPEDRLEVSFLGYQTLTILIGKQTYINVALKPQTNELDEVTIVAFGKQKKSSVIASIESVKTSDLRVPASNMTSAFAGKIPGIISYQTTGEPGADNAQFFVRGVTTFGYKASPLILIDGFEATSDDLARMQPDDVESFSILKDASATVLYGARGANGIILVSTKTGREGATKISARLDVNVATPTKMSKWVDGVQYMQLYNEASMSRNPELGAYYNEQKIYSTMRGENPMIYPNINWYDQLFNQYTFNTKANLNVSGGGKVATFYVAGGYDNETGLLKVDNRNNFNNNINIDRFNIRSNVIFKLTRTTTLDTKIQGRFERYNGPYRSASDIYKMIMQSNPVDFPTVYEPDEANQYTEHILFGNAFLGTSLMPNPYAEMVRGYEDRNESTMTAQATVLQDLNFITEGLKLQAKASTNVWSKYSNKRNYSPNYYGIDSYNQVTDDYKLFRLNPTNTAGDFLGPVIPDRDATGHTYFEVRLNWDRQFGKHSVGLMTVGMAEETLLTGGSSTSIYETLPERNMGNSGRLMYDYDTRYFFEFAYGYNGSEKFTGDKKYGFFPSFGAGWLVSNEAFWASMKESISSLKLKFTYGIVGNDAIAERADRFFFLSDISMGSISGNGPWVNGYTFGESFQNVYGGYIINRYANPDITWEISHKYNAGLELGLFKDESLKLQVDAFRENRNNIYMERTGYPKTTGFEAKIQGNVGKVQSQGLEASADYQRSFSKDFWMTGRFNFTYAVNKYIEMDEPEYPDEYLSHIGYNINKQWALVAERLFVDDAEISNSARQDFGEYQAGDIKYKDINGDGVVNDNDRIPMGFPTVPEIQYGFGLSSGYKKIDASFFFQGNARVSTFINSGVGGGDDGTQGIAPFASRRNALSIVAEDYWSETNPNVHAFWPRLSTSPLQNNMQQSSWWLRNTSFLRLKSIELGYTFSGVEKVGLRNSRIYLSAENMFVISAFKLWDPEMGRNGLGYPLNRRFNIGIQISY
jgi:TonB-linked SusC/RagA family outer membrane protein